ncbi:hypothetical protein FJ651_04965 [Paucihalobacter ruber]|uniref:Uncharacterized protein n=1 Tax=Paucihalobacter ruber TaxID=2567861 RepID=A0A506PNU8_9FLAO|nr:hypothetical protein [Paucihalobacter ruber]TPV34887.1 hypothetical protein FJ651_04965 [Paucihalobacter ruber]
MSLWFFALALTLDGDLTDSNQTGSQIVVVTMAFGLGLSSGSSLTGYAVRFGFVVDFSVAPH